MADKPNNIVLEHLRHIRRIVDKLETDTGEVKSRITPFEAPMGHVMAQIGHLQSQIASETGRIDRIEQRLDSIERRLDVTHA
jgi:hypothetical protein